MSGWWHRLRWASCAQCGREFRKGKGGGMSRRVLCSDACFIAVQAAFVYEIGVTE